MNTRVAKGNQEHFSFNKTVFYFVRFLFYRIGEEKIK